ncbi:uncharacterized protein [Montipora capricornis]|uniref:uncharacterized protein n=1 Tax=Montipora capricornis TaxID=246305 RepID=UPI0035F16E55
MGFAVKNTLLCMIQVPTNGTARMLTLRLSTAEGTVRLVCVYVPTLQSPPEVKDQFYEPLDTIIGMVPSSEHILLLGDFNVKVGADRESWPSILGHHGIGKMNDDGQRLLELCCYHNLCVTNTFFQNKACHKVSWRHPRSKHWHQLHWVITRRDSLNNVGNTRSYHSADCNTDHSLIASIVKLTPKKIYHSKQKVINTSKTAYSDKIQEFAARLEESLMYHHEQSVDDRSSSLRNTIYGGALLTFGKRERKTTDWFDAYITEMEPAIIAKRNALVEYERDPSQKDLLGPLGTRPSERHAAARITNGFKSQRESSKPLSPVISGTYMRASSKQQASQPRKLRP